MGNRQVGVLHGLTRLVAAEAAGLTDGQLLRRFAADRDDAAFAALIQRHGPLVYGVCRNVLRHEQDAEDAFQATFLVLARRAGAIREGLALGGWLYRVAYRVAHKARLAADRRRRREARVPAPQEDRPVGDLAWRELQAMLDEELNRLPEKYRAPFVLCVLNGQSKPEAAAALGWKEGTVSSRLAMAREKLRVRLARRGVALSAILSGLAIAEPGAATVPVALATATREAAVAYALGRAVAAGPAALARSVLRGMSLARLRHLGVALTLIGLAGTAVMASLPGGTPHEDPPPAPEVAAVAPPPAPRPEPAVRPAAPEMTFFGKVTDANGQPVPDARVAVSVGVNRPDRDIANAERFHPSLLGNGRADGKGSYQLTVPQTDPARNHRLTLLAKAPGYGYSALLADLDFKDQKWLNVPKPLTLIKGQPARARLLDPSGKPARGVTVHVVGMWRKDEKAGVNILYYAPPVPLPDWPGPFTTDDDGAFTVPDVVPGTILFCQPRDPRFGPEWVKFQARPEGKAGPPAIKLTPARVLTGRVLAADTGKPVADATVVVETPPPARGTYAGFAEARTDADGRYTLAPFPGPALKVTAYPPAGVPYPVFVQDVAWPAGAARHETDLTIPRGVLVRGTVEEADSRRRLAGAVVDYKWADRYRAPAERAAGTVSVRSAVTGPDGTFALAVPPGSGSVVVRAAEPDYVHTEIPGPRLRGYGKGGRPVFPDALAPLQLATGADPQEVTLRLRRGVTVRGRVLGADGKPAPNATLYALHYRPRGIDSEPHGVPVVDGRFELPGCEPGTPVPVWVYDARRGQGAVAELPADPAAEPVVRLAPTVSAKARFVDQLGRAVPKAGLIPAVVMRPGADEHESIETGARAMVTVADHRLQESEKAPAPNAQGDIVLTGLIPGAKYTFMARSPDAWSDRQTFTAPDSGTLDLGRITLRSKPRVAFRVGQLYYYQVVATDPDGDPVTITLEEGPAGMVMDPETSAVVWVPGPNQAGVHKVKLKASDPFGGTAFQTFELHVAP